VTDCVCNVGVFLVILIYSSLFPISFFLRVVSLVRKLRKTVLFTVAVSPKRAPKVKFAIRLRRTWLVEKQIWCS